tara:strand:+ start:1344 stop:3137 length:1794 start_codon:yes stop_codon:yes gene_type:complete
LGDRLKSFYYLFFYIILFLSNISFAQEKVDSLDKTIRATEYYQYWNPYRRVVRNRGEAHSFFGKTYYEVNYNNDNRIKSVTKFGKDKEPKETYHFIWSRSGIRSEYRVEFYTDGRASRLDSTLYADQLSYVRPGWIAQFRSRSDGRPREVTFSDPLGMKYFSYNFNYTFLKKDKKFSEVIESSYFDSDGQFVGRHLLFWERGAFLRMIQYFNAENKIFLTKEYLHDRTLEETVRVLTNEEGEEIERKIIPYMPPDKYAYKYEWTGNAVIDRGLKDIDNLDLAYEFAMRAQEALEKANEDLRLAKEAYNKANERAKRTRELLKQAERQAEEADKFKTKMEEAKVEAQNAIDLMYDAEREAELARLEAASAKATLDAIQKTRAVEDYAKEERRAARKDARKARRLARKEARAARAALQDSLLGVERKTFLTAAYGWPILVEETLQNNTIGVHYLFGLGKRNMFEFNDWDIDLGLEVNWYDFYSDDNNQNFQTLSYFVFSQIDVRPGWKWIPTSLETSVKFGGGLVSPGYGFTIGGFTTYNLLPTSLTISLFSQYNWVFGVIDQNTKTYWNTIGLQFGINLDDKVTEIIDIDLPDIFDIF